MVRSSLLLLGQHGPSATGGTSGEAQYASFNATCWATMALLQTIDQPHPGPQRAAR